ncbi:MAG: YihY/virulence factor BrkB family protein [Parafilimonas sp.]|nr:YihY/virulence factor BrkB family protein [Parafilimonas sp.]
MAAATAFFTTFSLPAILLILIEVIGLFYNEQIVKQGIFAQLVSVLGKESSIKVYEILDQFVKLAHNWFAAIAGFIFLVFVVTTLFSVVRSSINELWNVKVEAKPGVKFKLKLRLKAATVIFIALILMVTQLIATALQILLKNYIHEVWSNFNLPLYKIVTQLIFIIIASGWFTVLFKYLANAHPDWRTALTGGIFTGLFFTIGKIILGFLLNFNTLSVVFGKSGAFVLLLLFVFYCSFIFYYGAAFTNAWSNANNKKMELDEHAYVYEVKEVRSKHQ